MALRLLPELRWSQLIDATIEVLEEVRACEVVVEDVAVRTAVSRSLVYRYFDGVDDLVRHAHRRFFGALRSALARAVESERDPRDQLQVTIATTVHFAAQRPSTFGHLVDGGMSRDPNNDVLIGAIHGLVSTARPDRDAKLLAVAAAALVESGIVAWLRSSCTDTDAAEVIDLLFALATSGLGAGVSTFDQAPKISVTELPLSGAGVGGATVHAGPVRSTPRSSLPRTAIPTCPDLHDPRRRSGPSGNTSRSADVRCMKGQPEWVVGDHG